MFTALGFRIFTRLRKIEQFGLEFVLDVLFNLPMGTSGACLFPACWCEKDAGGLKVAFDIGAEFCTRAAFCTRMIYSAVVFPAHCWGYSMIGNSSNMLFPFGIHT